MAIPDFQSLMLPVLKASADGEVKIADVVHKLGNSLGLSDEELSELLPSGKQTTFANRVNWAKSYLGKAGLVTLTRRGYFQISEKGRAVLQSPPSAMNTKYLESVAGFKMYQPATEALKDIGDVSTIADELTPDERIRSARDELESTLAAELLEKILAAPPSFFERLVVQLLVAMGYGGSASHAGRALGKTGDGGVDGVIDQDALGLGKV
ncbi:MAG: winged helix-turn-helix domain-containing protein [Ramlibacter sp.]